MTPAAFNLRHLRALAAVVRLGSFSAAAKAVGISQPAVSQAIARLETLAKVRLLHRTPAGVQPTDAGILLGARAEAAAARLAEGLASQRQGGAGGRPGADAAITMTQVTALLAVADAGSYAAAAAKLGLAQPSLHRSVGELERVAGLQLLERRGRGVALTAPAERLARAFRLALAELQAAIDELAVLGGRDQGAVRIGAHPAALARLLPKAIARFLAEHPPVTIELRGDDAEALRAGRVDALVTLEDAQALPVGLEAESLSAEPLMVAARTGHPLAAGPAPGLVRLASFGWALPPVGARERDAWERLFLGGGILPPSPSVTCLSASALADIAANSDLLTVASQSATESGKLVPIGAPLDESRRLLLVTRAGWVPTPAQATFLEEVRAAASAVLAF
jgi:LysR family transcriptional regulator, regulator for genes of the gallate degradation pathway